jgi:hypothetical protein
MNRSDCPHCGHAVEEHVVIAMCNLIGCKCESDDLTDIEMSYSDLRDKCRLKDPGERLAGARKP